MNDNKKICLLVAALWSYRIFTLLVNMLVNLFLPNIIYDTIICYGIVFLFVSYAFIPVIKRLTVKDFFLFIIILFGFIFSLLFYPDNDYLIVNILPGFFLLVFPYYFLGETIEDFRLLDKYLSHVSGYVIWASVICYWISYINKQFFSSDNMSFSYFLLPSVLFMVYTSLVDGSFIKRLTAAAGVSVTFIAGTRGPILCVLFFFLLYLMMNLRKLCIIVVCVSFMIPGVLIYFNGFLANRLTELYHMFKDAGINLRILQQFLEGDLRNTSGRDVLYEIIINNIEKHPISGCGLMGDRIATMKFVGSIGGTYAHNLFLEMWCQFGIIFGSLLILAVIVTAFKAFFLEKDKYAGYFIAVLISAGLIKLMISGSYLFEPYLFLLMGVSSKSLYHSFSKKKNLKNTENTGAV